MIDLRSGSRAIADVHLSDHSPFWDAGTNALMVTATVKTLDLGVFSAVVEGLDSALRQI